jgi:hypothetical protein
MYPVSTPQGPLGGKGTKRPRRPLRCVRPPLIFWNQLTLTNLAAMGIMAHMFPIRPHRTIWEFLEPLFNLPSETDLLAERMVGIWERNDTYNCSTFVQMRTRVLQVLTTPHLRHKVLLMTRGSEVRVRWNAIKASVKFLGLQARAAVTANHPSRKRSRKEFEASSDDECT